MTGQIWHALNTDTVQELLETDIQKGLASDVASERLKTYGFNELRQEERVSPFVLFLNQFKNLLIIILLVATVLSALVGEHLDAALIFVIVIFCAILGFVQEYRAERALEALKNMLSPTITVLRDGNGIEIPSKELVPGDILLLEAGDRVPADARLFEAHSLKCDEAPLTGESMPVGKHITSLPEHVSIGDRKNMVFTGTTISYGRAKAVVTATAMQTEFGKIAEEVASVEAEKTPLEKRTEEIGKWLGIISFAICFLVAGISITREYLNGTVDFAFLVTMVMFAVSLAVAAVPEALAAIVTGALAIGMHQMAKRNALVRKMPAVETLGCTTVICSDKTGTLTKGEMTVRKIFSDNAFFDISGSGYVPEGEFKDRNSLQINPGTIPSLELLLRAGVLCNDALLESQNGKWFIKGDPTEGALIVAAAKAGMNQRDLHIYNERIEEEPFSSERKRMTTIHRMQNGSLAAFMKGAPEVVLERCSSIMDGESIKPIGAEERNVIHAANETMAKDALRVLGIAYRRLSNGNVCSGDEIESDLVFLGLVGMMDPPREEAIEATRICKQVHIRPVMITGDHKLTAVAIAKEIGFYTEGDRVLTGEELEQMSDDEFERIVDTVSVYARVSPMDKLKIVKAWKKRGEVVAMTGDGVNDAPALKQADIGIAMGITGTEVAKESADMVLSDDNFATIVSAIERGRWIYDNIKKYLTYLLRCNITEVVVIGGVVLVMGAEYLPMLPAAILYINLVTDGLPALALGVAPPDPDIMQRPPRDPKESVFSWDVKAFILMAIAIEIPFFFFLFFHDLSDIIYARTEIFFLFIIIELIIAFNFRSMRYSVFQAPPHMWLTVSIISQFILTAVVLQIPAVREAFGITVPSVQTIGMILAFGVVVFVSMEIVKMFVRRRVQLVKNS
ncbi:MAG: cation-translocating P-type ATPase [Syntrophaceae bacterium]